MWKDFPYRCPKMYAKLNLYTIRDKEISFIKMSLIFIILSQNLVYLGSISPTFFARVFRTNVFFLVTFRIKRTKNARKKRWWNWHLVWREPNNELFWLILQKFNILRCNLYLIKLTLIQSEFFWTKMFYEYVFFV